MDYVLFKQCTIYIYIYIVSNFQLTHRSFLNISCTLKNHVLQVSTMWLHSRDLRHEHRSALHPLPLLQLQADVINLAANHAESTRPHPPKMKLKCRGPLKKRSRDCQCYLVLNREVFENSLLKCQGNVD